MRSAITWSGSSAATSTTKSHSPRSATRSRISRRALAHGGLERAHHAGREALVDEQPVRVCSGGSMLSISSRCCSSGVLGDVPHEDGRSARRVRCVVAVDGDELVVARDRPERARAALRGRRTSGSPSCQQHGRLAPQRVRTTSCGDSFDEAVLVPEVDVGEHAGDAGHADGASDDSSDSSVLADLRRTPRHENSGITCLPSSSIDCMTFSCGMLYGLTRHNSRSQPAAS